MGWRTKRRLSLLAGLTLLMSLLPGLAGVSAGAAGPTVFINEIHYDNTGTDTGEGFEIAGPAGTDLSGWSVVLYNGNDTLSYNTVALSGTIPNLQAGFGALAFSLPTNGLQNGPSDGLALVDTGSNVVEFLSYEGSFAATNGPANGTTSTDIGVSEASNSPVGNSLQLVGTGTMGGDFTWASSQPDTFGALNTGQTFTGGSSGPIPGDLVITEVMQNPSAVDDADGEWFEIKNVSGSDIDIDGWTIRDDDSDSHTISGTLIVGAGGYVVLGNNDDTVTNGGVAVDYETPDFSLGNSADEVILEDPATELEFDRIEYDGGSSWPDPTGASMSLNPPAADVTSNDDGANWCEATSTFGDGDLGTPGADNDVCADPEPETVFIHEVQGSGSSVAITGEVRVQGIVTALFTRDDVLDAFFLQEEDADADLESMTSEGIFVFCRTTCPTVAPGDQVTVTGEAGDFFGMSQIDIAFGSGTAIIESSGNSLPTPVTVDLPASGSTIAEGTFENLEGMLVTFEDTLVVSEYFQLARFGQVVLTETARPFQFTHLNSPSVAGYAAFLDDLAKRRIILDDDNNDNNDAISDGPDEAYYYPEGGLSLGNKFRGGDTIDDLTGVLHWSFAGSSGTDAWRIRPIPSEYDYTFTSVNPEPGSPDPVGGYLQVASFNVLNYFTTIDTTSSGSSGDCGPDANLDCRGADSVAELERQRAKIVAAMDELDADILGLIEIENDDDASVADLVAGLNAVAGPGAYDYIATGFIGTDAIKVALIYQPDSVTPVGDFAILDSSVDSDFDDTKNRPVLAQTFVENATGATMTVAVNHLKSKGSPCDDVGDANENDGQGNCNGVRTDAAQALADWLATDPTGSGDPDYLVIGDLNAYAQEDPITALEASGYTDLIELFQGESAYSFVFDGQLGYLDHALANNSLVPQVTGVTEWHINADEVNVFDYNDDVRDMPGEASFERETTVGPLYAPDPLRSSDHDPLLVGLDMGARGMKERVQLELAALLPTGSKQDDKRIETAIQRLEQSLNPAYWDGEALDPITGNQAFDREHQAVIELAKVSSVDVSSAISAILEADEQLAVKELVGAMSGGGDADRIAQAQGNLADAAANIAAGEYAEAVLDYKKAWANAVKG